jgi:hypothetical protein
MTGELFQAFVRGPYAHLRLISRKRARGVILSRPNVPGADAAPVGAEYPVTSRDLGIFVDQAAEPVPTQDPGIQARSGRTLTPSGRSLAQCPVRAMNVTVPGVLSQDQP